MLPHLAVALVPYIASHMAAGGPPGPSQTAESVAGPAVAFPLVRLRVPPGLFPRPLSPDPLDSKNFVTGSHFVLPRFLLGYFLAERRVKNLMAQNKCFGSEFTDSGSNIYLKF